MVNFVFMTMPYESDPILDRDASFDAALHAVAYRDAETASKTFNMLEAAGLIISAVDTGREIDYERLGRLLAAFDSDPQLESHYEDDGTLVYYDEQGIEVRREEPSPYWANYCKQQQARKQAIDEHVSTIAPQYIEQLMHQLSQPGTNEAVLSLLIERGRTEGEIVSRSELALEAIAHVRDVLREQGFNAVENRRRVGPDGTKQYPKNQLTHTLLELTVKRPS